MEDHSEIPATFVLRKKPQVPAGFFEGFYASVKDELEANEAFASIGLVKRSKPALPVMKAIVPAESVVQQPKKRSRVIRLSIVSAVSAVAATIAVLVYFNQAPAEANPVLTENVTTARPAESEQELESYIAYLDEDELIDYIIDSEINLDDAYEEEIYDLVEGDIEDIYLDL